MQYRLGARGACEDECMSDLVEAEFGRAGSGLMAHDIDNDAIRVSDEKSPDAPGLVGQRIQYRISLLLGLRVTGVEVLDLDSDIRVRLDSAVGCDDTHLRRRMGGRGKGHDPTHVHRG